ncbi:MAG: hypothetical protein KDA24_12130 [Deltaproteobacteria bacterium]|nr:hypothetical protein [Deltaproteobacteria bacterium]
MRLSFIFGALLLVPTVAQGHATQAADGVDWHARGDRALLETTVGYLLSTDPSHPRDSWRWVCHEALSESDSVAIPRYTLVDGGVLAIIYTLGDDAFINDASIYRSSDGCDWSPPSGLDGQLVGGIAAADSGEVLAVTSNVGADNGAYLSLDSGESFAPTGLSGDARILQGVGWAAGGRMLVGAADFATGDNALLISDDDGETWVERALPAGVEPEEPRILTTHPTDPDTLWMRMNGLGADRLLGTVDGGESWTELLALSPGAATADSDLLDGTLLPDGTLLVTQGDGSMHEVDGDSVTTRADGPRVRATTATQDGVLHVADPLVEPWLLGLSVNGGDVTPSLDLGDLDRLVCPAETRTAVVCEDPWQLVGRVFGVLEPEGVGEPTLPPQDDRETPCGGSAAWLPLLLPLGLVRRTPRVEGSTGSH